MAPGCIDLSDRVDQTLPLSVAAAFAVTSDQGGPTCFATDPIANVGFLFSFAGFPRQVLNKLQVQFWVHEILS